MRLLCLVLVGGLVVNACGGGGGNGGTGPTPNTIAVNAGNNQVAAAGSALPDSLAVIVRDQAGDPLAGVNVTFAVKAGGGSVSPATRATDASGIAKTRRTLGPNLTFTTTATTLTTVQVANNTFTPNAVTIAAGAAVNWEWQGTTLPHNVTFTTAGAPANIADKTSGSDQRNFPSPGTFNYHCTNHGGMTGSVTVTP